MDNLASLSSARWGTRVFLAVRHCSTFVSQWLFDPSVVRRQENSLGSLTRHKYLPLCPELLGLYAELCRKDYHMNGYEFCWLHVQFCHFSSWNRTEILTKVSRVRGHNKELKGKNHLKPFMAFQNAMGVIWLQKILFYFHFPAEGRGVLNYVN